MKSLLLLINVLKRSYIENIVKVLFFILIYYASKILQNVLCLSVRLNILIFCSYFAKNVCFQSVIGYIKAISSVPVINFNLAGLEMWQRFYRWNKYVNNIISALLDVNGHGFFFKKAVLKSLQSINCG